MCEEIDYTSKENKLAVFTAWMDGKEWELKIDDEDAWSVASNHHAPQFLSGYLYRVKPTPKRVPLEAKDIPPVCWIKQVGDYSPELVVKVSDYSLSCGNNHTWNYSAMVDLAEYSTDRVNWKPCSKEA